MAPLGLQIFGPRNWQLPCHLLRSFPMMIWSLGAGFSHAEPTPVAANDAKIHSMSVLAMAASRAITDRQVAIDLILNEPSRYASKKFTGFSEAEIEQGLSRVITQVLVLEEARIVGSDRVSKTQLDSEMAQLLRRMGAQAWKHFLAEYGTSEADVRAHVEQRMLVQNAISARVKTALAPSLETSKGQSSEDLARQSIEEWLKQLKARYRVQMFRYPNKMGL